MRAAEQTYPPDEFDTVAPSGPRGSHRAPRSAWNRWWPFLAVLVLFPALAFAGVTWLSDWDGLPGARDAGLEGGAIDEPADDAEGETGDAEAPAEGEEPEASEPEATEPEATEPAPEPDLALPVDVLNSTNISGLAGSAGQTLEDAGFTAVSTGNWRESDPETSVVWFPTEEAEVTARAVADALGIATVEASDQVENLTVVLAPDAAG